MYLVCTRFQRFRFREQALVFALQTVLLLRVSWWAYRYSQTEWRIRYNEMKADLDETKNTLFLKNIKLKEYNAAVKIKAELEQRVEDKQDELHAANEKWRALDEKYRDLKHKGQPTPLPQQERLGESLKDLKAQLSDAKAQNLKLSDELAEVTRQLEASAAAAESDPRQSNVDDAQWREISMIKAQLQSKRGTEKDDVDDEQWLAIKRLQEQLAASNQSVSSPNEAEFYKAKYEASELRQKLSELQELMEAENLEHQNELLALGAEAGNSGPGEKCSHLEGQVQLLVAQVRQLESEVTEREATCNRLGEANDRLKAQFAYISPPSSPTAPPKSPVQDFGAQSDLAPSPAQDFGAQASSPRLVVTITAASKARALECAQKKFEDLDSARSGYLSDAELLVLVEYLWSVYEPAGVALSLSERQQYRTRCLIA